MSFFLGQRVALGPRTGAIIDIRSPSSVTVHFDSGGVEDVDLMLFTMQSRLSRASGRGVASSLT